MQTYRAEMFSEALVQLAVGFANIELGAETVGDNVHKIGRLT